MRLKFQHSSLQFSDTAAQHTRDIERIFARGAHVLTGTEAGAGAGNTSDELARVAKKRNYRLAITERYDTWVAISRDIIVPGSWRAGSVHAVDRSSRQTPKPPGRWGDKGVVWGGCEVEGIGTLSVGAVHYVTHGGAGDLKQRLDNDYARVIGEWAKKHGAGSAVAFVGGDFNLSDRFTDVFKGFPLTTCWDELHTWPSTGHGNIDAVASYDPDKRVRALRAKAFNDELVPLATDHFLIEAVYDIQERP